MLSQQNTNVPLDLDFKIGLGFFLYKSELNYAGRFVGHGGDTDFFHADLSTLPDHKIGVIVLTNSKGGGVISDKISLLILKKVLAYKEGINAPEPDKKTIKIVKNDSLEGLNNYLGMYSIGNDVFNISKRKGHFYFKQSGQSIYLLPNNKGSFTPKVVLFGLIPIKLWNQEINFRTMGDKDYLAFKNEGLFGVKIQNYTIDDEWKKRVGDYALLNKGNDVYYPEKISLEIKEGLLYFKLRFFNMNMKLILQTLNNNEAVNLGIGRYAMETIYVTKDDKGEEVLHYSGYEFKIIKKE
jgi:hypothetical protein